MQLKPVKPCFRYTSGTERLEKVSPSPCLLKNSLYGVKGKGVGLYQSIDILKIILKKWF